MADDIRISGDFESRSIEDIKKTGGWVYNESAGTDTLCFAYRVDVNGKLEDKGLWTPYPFDGDLGYDKMMGDQGQDYRDHAMPCPPAVENALARGAIFEAHNVVFEIGHWENQMARRWGWPSIDRRKWRDSMAVACYYALPAGLDSLSRVLFGRGKDPEGSRLITKYSKLHLKTAKRLIPLDDWRAFGRYCESDVEEQFMASNYLGDLPEREELSFWMDLDMNLRGMKINLASVAKAVEILEAKKAKLTQQFNDLVGLNPTQGEKFLVWLYDHGLVLENLQKNTLADVLDADGEAALGQGPVRTALEIRKQINRASAGKLEAMARNASAEDHRARCQMRYHGATTGRGTAPGGFQPLNMSRGYDAGDRGADIPERLIQDIMHGDDEWLDMVYGDAMEAVSMSGRHHIIAEPGNILRGGDFVSVEAVVASCLSGEEWKIQAFRDRVPMYALMAGKIYPELVDEWKKGDKAFKSKFASQRQDGKVGDLAFGFGGSLGAWLKFDRSGRHTDEGILKINRTWRAEHPMYTAMWYGLGDACIEAVDNPGRVTGYREIGYETVDQWLTMILPNGKRLWAWSPKLRWGMPKWHNTREPSQWVSYEDADRKNLLRFADKIEDDRVLVRNIHASGECQCQPMHILSYETQKGGHWQRIDTYGPHQFQNATQASAREILEEAKKAVYHAGYPLVLSVYDEIVAECRPDFHSKKAFAELLETSRPAFAKDWPIFIDVGDDMLSYRK